MRRQQDTDSGVQASIVRFAQKAQQQAKSSSGKVDRKSKLENSTLLQVLGASTNKARHQQQQPRQTQDRTAVLPSLLQSAVFAAAPPPAKGSTRSKQADPEVSSLLQQPHGTPAAAARAADSTLQPCPLCGQQLPAEQLQQHVDAELAELDGLEGPSQQQDSPQQQVLPQRQTTVLGQQHRQKSSSNWWPQAPQQQQYQSQQQQQQQRPAQSYAAVLEQPQAKRQKQLPTHHQQHAQQRPQWQEQQQHRQQQQQSQQPWWLYKQHPQQQPAPPQPQHTQHPGQHQAGLTRQQHRGSSSSKGSIRHTNNGSSGSRRVQVKSLSAAPRRPVGPDGQPITQLDGGFDHWGDSSINYLDDSAIGIDGSLPSADAYWEGVGRCAIGPRTLR